VNEALWGFFGVIIGALASSGTTLWVARAADKSRIDEAAAERLRAALYGLQDELTGFTRVSAALLQNPKDAANGSEAVVQLDRVQRFASRAGDQQIYESYRAIRLSWFQGPDPVTQYQAWRDRTQAIYDGPVSDMNNRIGLLLQAPHSLTPLTIDLPEALPVPERNLLEDPKKLWDRLRPSWFR
jgi:hypothetical protein